MFWMSECLVLISCGFFMGFSVVTIRDFFKIYNIVVCRLSSEQIQFFLLKTLFHFIFLNCAKIPCDLMLHYCIWLIRIDSTGHLLNKNNFYFQTLVLTIERWGLLRCLEVFNVKKSPRINCIIRTDWTPHDCDWVTLR